MKSSPRAPLSRALASVLTGALVAAAALVGVVAPAQAATEQATASELSWGVKTSWRSYVTGFGGTATASGGAAVTESGYSWSAGPAQVDAAAAAGSASFSGSVQFVVPSHGVDITIADPRVVFADGTGGLYWSAADGVEVLGATIGSVSLGTPVQDGSNTVARLTGGNVAFTADGSAAFGGSYGAGEAIDDLSFTLVYATPVAAPTATSVSLAVSPDGSSAPGTDIVLTATVTPAVPGSVTFSDSAAQLGDPVAVADGVAAFTVKGATAGDHGFTAAFTPDDAAAFTGSASGTVTHTVTTPPVAPVFTPSISVFLADGTTPYTGQPVYTDETLVVKGSGFDPAANVGGRGVPIPKTLPQGTYVILGSFEDAWRPSASAPSSARKVVSQAWALTQATLDQVPAQYLPTIQAQWTELTTDGTFSVALTANDFASALPGGTWGVYTYGAGGVSNAAQELSVAVDYVGERPGAGPAIRLKADSVQQGATLHVDGTGFPAGQDVTVTLNSDPVTLGVAAADASGAFSVTGTVPASFAPGLHTVLATAGDVTASAEVTVTAAAIVPVTPVAPPAPEPTEPACIARAVSGAGIEWSVKQSFRDYITGGIAKGTYSGGWGAGSGSFNTDEDRGRVGYSGSMSFSGHDGTLEITISNPRIQVHSATSASLILAVQTKAYNGAPSVDASSVAFATLSLPAANESGSRISWTGAAATLTAAGAQAFAGFYPAGTALDPVSFSFPLGAEVPCDASTSSALAATGSEAPLDALWLGVGMLVLGAGVYVLRRRTVRV